jgi:hypothetical protein
MREASVLRQCMLALSDAGCAVFRANVGLFYTRDGRPVQTGLPRGFSDLFGFRPDGRAFFVECKSATGRLRPEQKAFLDAMRARGAVAVVARSADTIVAQVLGFPHQ